MSIFSDNQECNRFSNKKKQKPVSAAERMYNANLSQSDSDISPQMSRDAKVIKNQPTPPPRKKAPATSETYRMPKQTTPDMDTTQGSIGSRNNFDEGETSPKTADVSDVTSAPVEERYIPKAKNETARFSTSNPMGMKKGGSVSTSKASSRGDGIAQRGKTKGRLV